MTPAGWYGNSQPPPTLLEVTVISAQDLHRRSGRVRAYAVAWADAAHKLRTHVDHAGRTDPTWNDKFVFRVEEGFLRSDMAAVHVEVRAARGALSLGEDPVLGFTRIVVSTFVRPWAASQEATSRHVAALQLRRPQSLRPQGIVNVAVALLDAGHAPIMSLYYPPGSPRAFAVKDLVMSRPPSMGKIADAEYTEEERMPPVAFVERFSGPLEANAAVEQRLQKELESKLEKWKTELSPDQNQAGGGARRRRRSFCMCGTAEWDK